MGLPAQYKEEFFPLVAKWIAVTALWYFIRYRFTLDWKGLIESPLSSLAINVLWLAIRISIRQQLDLVVKKIADTTSKVHVVIPEHAHLNLIGKIRPLREHYTEQLHLLYGNISSLTTDSAVELDPYSIYIHILSCAKRCEKEIVSVDCDLTAWYYVCEQADFDALSGVEEEVLSAHRAGFAQERRLRARTDFTSKLSEILMERLGEPRSFSMTPGLRRIFVVRKSKDRLDIKERLVIRRMAKLQKSVMGRMQNRFIFVEDLDNAPRALSTYLQEIQDVVIFDGCLVFREFLLEPGDARATQGQMTTSLKQVERYHSIFDILYNDAEEIFTVCEEINIQ